MEIWKQVAGYEGLYEVSNIGRVKSLERTLVSNRCTVVKKSKIKPLNNAFNGYLSCALLNNGSIKTHFVHRLVAFAFIQNEFNKPFVNHKNGIKTDNRVENLEWCTRSENAKHSFTIGLQDNKGESHPKHKLSSEQVLEIRAKYKPYVYERKKLAEEYGVGWTTIKGIVNNKQWRHLL